MIQRIQSLFLLAAIVLCVIIIVHPISSMILTGLSEANFYSYGLMSAKESSELYFSTFPIIVLASISAILSVYTILIFRKRTLQMRMCVFNILITLGLIISIVIYYFIIKGKYEVSSHAFSYSAVLPFINVILIFQAFRGIRRDDLLLKSYNRLRD